MADYDQTIEKLKRLATEATASARITRIKRSERGRVLMNARQVDVVQRIAFIAGALAGAATVGAVVLLVRCL